MASIAVFVALGGGAYAAVTIDGKDLRNRSVAAKKLKNNTLSGKQINEKRLGRVPRSRAALRARYALRAGSADSAVTAGTASSATTAGSATTASNATRAATAGRADSAATADSATTAQNAATLDGAGLDSLLVTCPADTELLGGVCWDIDQRDPANWFVASEDCFTVGGRLPTLSELVGYFATQPPGDLHWSTDLEGFVGGSPSIVVRDEATTAAQNATSFSTPYRCVFNQSNDL